MKKLLSLLSALVISSSAASSVEAFSNNPKDSKNKENETNNNVSDKQLDETNNNVSNDKNEINTKNTIDGNFDSIDKGKYINMDWSSDETNFDIEEDGKINKASLDFRLSYGKALGGIHDIETIRINKVRFYTDGGSEDTKLMAKYFKLVWKTSSDSRQLWNISLQDNWETELPKIQKDFKLDIRINYTTDPAGWIKKEGTWSIPIYLDNRHEAPIPKEEISDTIGTPVFDIKKLTHKVDDFNYAELEKEIRTKFDEQTDNVIAGEWHFYKEASTSENSVVIEANKDSLKFKGQMVIKYELSQPDSYVPADVQMGEVEDIDKYEVTKNTKSKNAIKVYNTLQKWFENNQKEQYDKIKWYIEAADAIYKPNTNTKEFHIVSPYESANGSFTVSFSFVYADLNKYVASELGKIEGIDTISTPEQIKEKILENLNNKYPDFKGMFDVVINDGQQIGVDNNVKLVVKDLKDPEKQIFEPGKEIELNFKLDKKDLSDILKDLEEKGIDANAQGWDGHFLDDKDVLKEENIKFIESQHPELKGKVQIDDQSWASVDSSNPDTWTVILKPTKDGAETITGNSNPIHFDLKSVDINKFVEQTKLTIKDKFFLAKNEEIKASIIEEFNTNNKVLNGKVELKTNVDKFDSKDPSTWKAEFVAINKINKYLTGTVDNVKFDMAKVKLNEIIANGVININQALLSTTLDTEEKIKAEVLSVILGKDKKFSLKSGSEFVAYPELDGIIKLGEMTKADNVNGSIEILVDENYENKNYIEGTAKANIKLTQVDLASVISFNDVVNIIKKFNTANATENSIKAAVKDLVKNATQGELKENEYEIITTFTKEDIRKVSVEINVTDPLSKYTNGASGEGQLELADISNIVSDYELLSMDEDYISFLKDTNKTEFKNKVLDVISDKHKEDKLPLTKEDIEITGIDDTKILDNEVLVTVSGKKTSGKFAGTKTLKVNIKASSLIDQKVFDTSIFKGITDKITEMQNKVIDGANKAIKDNYNFLSDKLNSSFEMSTKEIYINAKDEYKKVLTGTAPYKVEVVRTDIKDMFEGTDEAGVISIGKIENLGPGANFENDILPIIKKELAKRNKFSKQAESHDLSFLEHLKITPANDWKEINGVNMFEVTVAPNDNLAKDYLGGAITFRLEADKINIGNALQNIELTSSIVTYYENIISEGVVKQDVMDAFIDEIKEELKQHEEEMPGINAALNIDGAIEISVMDNRPGVDTAGIEGGYGHLTIKINDSKLPKDVQLTGKAYPKVIYGATDISKIFGGNELFLDLIDSKFNPDPSPAEKDAIKVKTTEALKNKIDSKLSKYKDEIMSEIAIDDMFEDHSMGEGSLGLTFESNSSLKPNLGIKGGRIVIKGQLKAFAIFSPIDLSKSNLLTNNRIMLNSFMLEKDSSIEQGPSAAKERKYLYDALRGLEKTSSEYSGSTSRVFNLLKSLGITDIEKQLDIHIDKGSAYYNDGSWLIPRWKYRQGILTIKPTNDSKRFLKGSIKNIKFDILGYQDQTKFDNEFSKDSREFVFENIKNIFDDNSFILATQLENLIEPKFETRFNGLTLAQYTTNGTTPIGAISAKREEDEDDFLTGHKYHVFTLKAYVSPKQLVDNKVNVDKLPPKSPAKDKWRLNPYADDKDGATIKIKIKKYDAQTKSLNHKKTNIFKTLQLKINEKLNKVITFFNKKK